MECYAIEMNEFYFGLLQARNLFNVPYVQNRLLTNQISVHTFKRIQIQNRTRVVDVVKPLH